MQLTSGGGGNFFLLFVKTDCSMFESRMEYSPRYTRGTITIAVSICLIDYQCFFQ
jgi:hypothetical protein